MTSSFRPNTKTFAACLAAVKQVKSKLSISSDHIVTSKDAGVVESFRALSSSTVPDGFSKYQLPVFFEGGPGALFFVSVGAPGTQVPTHAHEEGDGIRYIVSGSIHFNSKELSAGDWMFIPKGVPYSFTVGINGMTAFYCYQCCCA